jgi:hypothetical protein
VFGVFASPAMASVQVHEDGNSQDLQSARAQTPTTFPSPALDGDGTPLRQGVQSKPL